MKFPAVDDGVERLGASVAADPPAHAAVRHKPLPITALIAAIGDVHPKGGRCVNMRLGLLSDQPPFPGSRTPGRRHAHTVAVFARASVCRGSACGLVERFGSRDDAVIVELADLEGRQSEDLSEDFVGVFAKQRRRPRGGPG